MNDLWPAVPLEELCDRITVGHVGPMMGEYVSDGIPFLRSQNILPFQISMDNMKYIPPAFHEKLRKSSLRPGDVAVVRTGYPGTAAVIPAWLPSANCADLVVITPGRGLDPFFLAAVFNSTWGIASIGGRLVGSAQQHFNVGAARKLELHVPPLATQRKIAAILSAYDDLIENNNRRIVLLEETAKRIFREWFVDFRYPGHQDVALVDSELGPIPEGWGVRRMDEVAAVVDCLHSKKPKPLDAGPGVLLQLFNIGSAGKIDLSQTYRVSAEDYEQWTSRIELRGGDCVITNVGRIAAVAQIPPECRAAPGRNMTAVRPRDIPPTYLLQYLLSEHMAREVHRKKDAGSVMDSLNVKGIIKLAVPIPGGELAFRFENIARPMRRELEVLVAANETLRAARGLLLPRLVSGDVDVTEVDVAMPDDGG